MPCINCYISWAQQALTYAGIPMFVWLLAQFQRLWSSNSTPRYGPQWAPPFVGGVMAAVKLGQDEDGFIAHCAKEYGAVVYLPWPLCQYIISDSDTIQRVYEAPNRVLSFPPIRTGMSHTIFDTGLDVCNSGVMEKRLYPAHSKSLTKAQLSGPMDRFVASVRVQIDNLVARIDASDDGVMQVDASDLINTLIFDGAVPSLFGSQLYALPSDKDSSPKALSPDAMRQAFIEFDAAFPLLASELLPPWLQRRVPLLRRGIDSRDRLLDHFVDWIERGAPDCDEGPIKAMVDVGAAQGVSPRETATWLLGTYWAMQANAPFAATHVMLHVLQAPPATRAAVQAELTAYLNDESIAEPFSFNTLSSSDVLPLLTSAILETLRLESSTFSIRNVEAQEGYPVYDSLRRQGKQDSQPAIVPRGGRIVCATRLSQLNGAEWIDDDDKDDDDDKEDDESALAVSSGQVWDAERFLGERGSQRTRKLRAFGGGISICEGRHLALGEIKVTVMLLLEAFEFKVLPLTAKRQSEDSWRVLRFKGGENGIAPKRVEGRVGMGIFQARPGFVAFELKRRGRVTGK